MLKYIVPFEPLLRLLAMGSSIHMEAGKKNKRQFN